MGIKYQLSESETTPMTRTRRESNVTTLHRGAKARAYVAVYECVPDASRAYVVPKASVVPEITVQLARLFEESFDAGATVMLSDPPPRPAGSIGAPEPPSARIVHDAMTR